MWILAILGAVAGGTAATYAYDEESPLSARLLVGIPLGFALLGLLGYVVARLLGLAPGTVLVAPALLASPLVASARLRRRLAEDLRASWRGRGRRRRRLLALGATALVLGAAFERACFEAADGLYTGTDHNLGDLPFHIAVITGFTEGRNFPPEHPELSGVRLTYPFAVDLGAALLVAGGASLPAALFAQNLMLAVALVGLLHRCALRLTRDGRAARLAVLLALLNGGLGFVELATAAGREPGGWMALLRHLPQDYTITWDGAFRWGNVVTTLLIPQRAFLLGLPLALAVITLWWRAVVESPEEGTRTRLMAGAGVLTGLLPLVHSHSFAVLVCTAALLAPAFPRWRAFGAYALGATLVAAPQVLWLAAGSSVGAGRFVAWAFGWDRGERNALWFWLTNTGLFLPLLAAALATARGDRLARFTAPFLAWLLVPNLLRLSPWIWDNVKFLIYGYLAAVPLIARVLARLSRRGRVGLAASAALAVALTASGGLDVFRLTSRQVAHRLYDAEGMAFARRIIETTPPRAVVLHAATHDSVVYLSGRRSLLGYPGHIWSQGLDAGEREAVLREIYAGGPGARDALRRWGIGFVLVGPQEASQLAVSGAFLGRLPTVAEQGSYRLVDAR